MNNKSNGSSAENRDVVIVAQEPIIEALKGNRKDGGFAVALKKFVEDQLVNGVRKKVTFISPDEEKFSFPEAGIGVLPLESKIQLTTDRILAQFDQIWAYLHPKAYADNLNDAQLEARMYQGEYTESQTVFGKMLEHFSKYGALAEHNTPNVVRDFCLNYHRRIDEILVGSEVHFSDIYSFPDLFNAKAETLRRKGCELVTYDHEVLPDSLIHSEYGRSLLSGLSKLDIVYLHTDKYISNLQKQLDALDLRIPDLRRFDLGVERKTLDDNLDLRNFDKEVLSFAQGEFVEEVLRTRGQIPHRFISVDRLDPLKGNHVYIGAIRKFLENSSLDLAHLQKNFRFFFVSPLMELNPINTYEVSRQYLVECRERLFKLIKDFPGIIFVTDVLPRAIISGAMVGCNVVTGGSQDGLNLACQEGAYVNAVSNMPAVSVVGSGAGFAIQTKASGYGGLGFFPEAGNVDSFEACIRRVVEVQKNDPDKLRQQNRALVEQVILKRTDSALII